MTGICNLEQKINSYELCDDYEEFDYYFLDEIAEIEEEEDEEEYWYEMSYNRYTQKSI